MALEFVYPWSSRNLIPHVYHISDNINNAVHTSPEDREKLTAFAKKMREKGMVLLSHLMSDKCRAQIKALIRG